MSLFARSEKRGNSKGPLKTPGGSATKIRGLWTRIELPSDSSSTCKFNTRSAAGARRYLVYRAEPYLIELLIESAPGRDRLMITGQLFDTSSPELFGSDVQMALWDGHLSFVLLKTNEWGEFLGEIEKLPPPKHYLASRRKRDCDLHSKRSWLTSESCLGNPMPAFQSSRKSVL